MIKTKHIGRLLVAIVGLLICLNISAQNYKVKTKAPNMVFVGEQFSIDYEVETSDAVEQVSIELEEDTKGLEIVYGPTRNVTQSISNKAGKREVRYIVTFTYLMEGNKKTKMQLPRATLLIDGKKYKSDVAKIEIKSIEDTYGAIHAFVKPILSRPSINLSDTVMITYKLYTTKEIRSVLDANLPMTDDFFSSNVTPYGQDFGEEKVDGKIYKTLNIKTLILQPRSVGLKEIPSGSITVAYFIPTGRKLRNAWGQMYDEQITKKETITIDSIKISVQNLQEI